MALGALGDLARHAPWVLSPALGLAAATNAVQRSIGKRHLVTTATPKGPIIAWQRAGTEQRMKEIVEAWGPEGRHWAGRTLAWDTGFLLSYGFALSLACSIGAIAFDQANAGIGTSISVGAAWASILAALLDFGENCFLWGSLRPFDGDGLPRRMYLVSRAKWLLLGVLVPTALVGLVVAAID
jgi:hypothetical protein